MSDIWPATISTLIEFQGETTCNYQINHKLQIQPLRPQNKNIKGKMWRFRCGDWGRQAPESRCVRSTHEDCALAHSHTPFRESSSLNETYSLSIKRWRKKFFSPAAVNSAGAPLRSAGAKTLVLYTAPHLKAHWSLFFPNRCTYWHADSTP